MNTYQIICLIGVPTVSAAIVGWMITKYKTLLAETKALKLGVQALLRNELYRMYNEAKSKGFSTLDEKDNFLNMYNQYHSLGKNGVMDSKKEEYMSMPDSI